MLGTPAILTISIASAALLVMAACSRPSQPPSQAPAPQSAAPAAAPAAGAIKLDIKDASGAQLSGDPADGKQVFMQCMTCHATDAGVNRVGPSLHGIVGRHSGTVAAFNYSDANKNSGKTWSEQELYIYLENPQKEIPGTYMTYTGVKNPQKRADVIAFLQETTK